MSGKWWFGIVAKVRVLDEDGGELGRWWLNAMQMCSSLSDASPCSSCSCQVPVGCSIFGVHFSLTCTVFMRMSLLPSYELLWELCYGDSTGSAHDALKTFMRALEIRVCARMNEWNYLHSLPLTRYVENSVSNTYEMALAKAH
jgi:hypothetical protein